MLLLTTVTIRDTHAIHHDGILGELECRLWNTQALLWGLFKSSTWNLVALTIERYFEYYDIFYVRRETLHPFYISRVLFQISGVSSSYLAKSTFQKKMDLHEFHCNMDVWHRFKLWLPHTDNQGRDIFGVLQR